MQCPKCKMNNRDENKVCMYCGFDFGSININQIVPNNIPQQHNPNNGVNNNTVVQNTNNIQNNKMVEVTPTNTHSKILVTLPALGILIIYSYIIISFSITIFSMLVLAHKYNINIMDSKEFLKYIGIDLLLIVSFILTVLHKKFMGFAAIVYSIIYIIYRVVIIYKAYNTIKFNLLVFPLIIVIFVIICALLYLKEEEPV